MFDGEYRLTVWGQYEHLSKDNMGGKSKFVACAKFRVPNAESGLCQIGNIKLFCNSLQNDQASCIQSTIP